MKPETAVIDWLLTSSPWVVYRTRLDLLEQSEENPQVITARQSMLTHPLVQGLLDDLKDWPRPQLNSHKSAGHPLHKLAFLADLGLRLGDPGVDEVIERILEHQSSQGPFQVLMKISPSYGGSGQEELAWALCDAPVVLHSLIRLGLGADPRVQRALNHLIGLARENGWPCAVSPELGRWRGPGKKEDPCPYANLVMLKALAELPETQDSHPAHAGAEAILALWEQSRERNPYLFYMGTDFRKLKAPLIWYDLLHVIDVLTRFAWLRTDPRLQEMSNLLAAKADTQGRFTPESIWKAWGNWDFGQKKIPSPWLTTLAWRVLARV